MDEGIRKRKAGIGRGKGGGGDVCTRLNVG
jgi:hypothetical protein